MKTIRKTGMPSTYFEGDFELRNRDVNWAHPIDFPAVFVAYGRGIKSGNWSSCTSINTPQYVIDNYFKGRTNGLNTFWEYVFKLEKITWLDVEKNKPYVLQLLGDANNELSKLTKL